MVGVPLAFLGAFVFHFPIYGVYMMMMMDEITKGCVAMWRFFSGRWLHNLTHSPAAPESSTQEI